MVDQKQPNSKSDHRQLVFSVGDEPFAVPLIIVKEVIAVPDFTPVPFTPKFVLGVMNLRGQVITVLDLRLRLGVHAAEFTKETSVIICETDDHRLGLLVDSIIQVINPKPTELHNNPEIERTPKSQYVRGIYRKDDYVVTLLDVKKTIDISSSIKTLTKAA